MRDIAVTLIVFGSLPYILKRPYIGILMWVWISVMNPHTQGWGFARTFPFASIIGAATLLGLILTRDPKKLPSQPVVWILFLFVLWMNVTTLFALKPEYVYRQWSTVMKIMLMTFVTLMLIKTERQIKLLLLMLVVSLGFYGVKGGIFTALSGGSYTVWGPDNTFIGGNNEVALALIMTIPLMHYLQTLVDKPWMKHALTASMGLCALAAIGSYSRGALLALLAMGALLAMKSRQKARIIVLLLLSLPAMFAFMPEKWVSRMDTIQEYQSDASAMGRINAWWMAYNLAKDRPLVGGGFEIYEPDIFAEYAPNPTDIHAAHSIYFQTLGEHGFFGLGLYLMVAFFTWRTASWIISHTTAVQKYKWAYDMARMIQVSLAGFGVGGAFLSLLYFDVPYYLMAILVVTRALIEKELQLSAQAEKRAVRTNIAGVRRPAHGAFHSQGERTP